MINTLLRPLEIYVLLKAFSSVLSFDRNLSLDDVEDYPVDKNLEIIHLIEAFTNYKSLSRSLFLSLLLVKQNRFYWVKNQDNHVII